MSNKMTLNPGLVLTAAVAMIATPALPNQDVQVYKQQADGRDHITFEWSSGQKITAVMTKNGQNFKNLTVTLVAGAQPSQTAIALLESMFNTVVDLSRGVAEISFDAKTPLTQVSISHPPLAQIIRALQAQSVKADEVTNYAAVVQTLIAPVRNMIGDLTAGTVVRSTKKSTVTA